ncbi:MAG: hypothetical protein E4H01_10330 [Lysobacterales bacterium]|nr:MAG: hypothetical protein E4H01_10330 [Xanthomonadales bacterium]
MATARLDPLGFPHLTDGEIHAIKSVWAGEGNKDQQRLALNVVMVKFARLKNIPFQPGSPDESAFLAGRMFVGQVIAMVIEKDFDKLSRNDKDLLVKQEDIPSE